MISSVPYVPPDTMKKVAATSGHSVNLAMDFLAVGNAREGYWAGSDKELNLYSRPPQRSSLARCGEASSQSQNTRVLSACKRKMSPNENIFSNSLGGLSYWSADAFSVSRLNPAAVCPPAAHARLLVCLCS